MSETTFTIPEESGAPAEPVSITPDPVAAAADPGAPYGRFDNGKPRKSPPKAARSRGPRTAAAPRPSAPRAPKAKAPADFTPVIREGLSLLSLPLIGLGRMNRSFLADAAALQLNAEPLSHALNECARINPTIERLLTNSAPAVPYVLLGSALFNLGVQIAANHGRAVPVPGVKVQDPEQLADGMERQMRTAQEQHAAAAEREAAAADRQGAAEHQYATV